MLMWRLSTAKTNLFKKMIKYYVSKDYLFHHGIKGQKWGLRRYQNYDGSLTSEGRRRLQVADATVERWGRESDKKMAKAQAKLSRAKTAKAKAKAQDEIDKIKDYEKRANSLNGSENALLRKKSETKEEYARRYTDVLREYTELDNYYTPTAAKVGKEIIIAAGAVVASGFFGVGAGVAISSGGRIGSAVAQEKQFKSYADIYMRQPADKFIVDVNEK